ncbi:MAG TPA: bile acid:sodium symporter family protein, partial [Candidatus Thermoplasmatota archaeon]|nr:bile acid:sodium symporter family protein [Candidatus Thermoplasmatota archaeon]
MAGEGLVTNALSDVVLPLALAVVMFGMGMSLTGADFARIARQPRAVAVGLVAQVLVLPVVAALVAVLFLRVFAWPDTLVLGLLLLACCPGGTTSNLVTWLARADAALSVTVTAVNSIASAITTPLAFLVLSRVVLGEGARVQVSFLEMAGLVVAVVVVPVVLGMLLRRVRPVWASRAERPMRLFSALFLALVIAGVIFANRADFWTLAARSVPAVLVLNILALGSGLVLGRLAGLSTAQERAVSIEVGFQNGTLGIAIAVGQLGSAEAAIIPGFYGLVMFATGGVLAWIWSRDVARQGRAVTLVPSGPRVE